MNFLKRVERYPFLYNLARFLFIAIPLFFLFRSLFGNLQVLQTYDWQFDGIRGGLALVVLMGSFGLLPLASQQVLMGLGYRIGYQDSYCGYFMSQLAKYLPGGLWVIPGRALVFRRIGISAVISSVGIIAELGLLILSGTVVFIPYTLFNNIESLRRLMFVSGLLVPLLFLCLHPNIFNPILRWLLARIGHTDVVVNLTFRTLLKVFLIYLAFWLAAGLGFFFVVSSIHRVPLRLYLVFPSTLSIAWIAGFLVFLTPGGIGVREGVMAYLLAFLLPSPLPAVVALLARLWWTLADVLSAGIAAWLQRGQKIIGNKAV